jgi:hypothetical protein
MFSLALAAISEMKSCSTNCWIDLASIDDLAACGFRCR